MGGLSKLSRLNWLEIRVVHIQSAPNVDVQWVNS